MFLRVSWPFEEVASAKEVRSESMTHITSTVVDGIRVRRSQQQALAAERRKGSNTTKLDAKEAEKQLQAIYGPDIHILHESDDLIVLSKPT